MTCRRILLVSITFGLLAFVPSGYAAQNLDQLLEETRTIHQRESQENAERERRFEADRDKQAAMFSQAEAETKALETTSHQLSAQYDANDKQINELEVMVKERSGNLGELFGVTRQVAGDMTSVLYQSMISAQFPDRDAFFRMLASSRKLPSSASLERMWYEMQREMTESGRVATLHTKIVEADGSRKDADVVRIGPFIAMSGGRYLTYMPDQKILWYCRVSRPANSPAPRRTWSKPRTDMCARR